MPVAARLRADPSLVEAHPALVKVMRAEEPLTAALHDARSELLARGPQREGA